MQIERYNRLDWKKPLRSENILSPNATMNEKNDNSDRRSAKSIRRGTFVDGVVGDSPFIDLQRRIGKC